MRQSRRRAFLLNSGASFPLDITGLILWTRPESLSALSDGDPINQWVDESGAGNHLDKIVDATRPIYKTNILNGKASVRHTVAGQNVLTRTVGLVDSNMTILYVAKYTNTTTPGRIVGAGNNWLVGFYTLSMDNCYMGDWILGPGGGPAHDTTARLYAASRVEATNVGHFYVNGGLLATNANGLYGPSDLSTNGLNAGTAELSNSDLFEIVLYNKVLDATERGRVTTYLNQKYLIF
jgi:hypothetical protein